MQAVMTAAPARTDEQRMRALVRANEIRSHRAQLKRQVKRGQRPVVEILRAPESEVATMKVFDLLLAAPKVGRVKASKWLSQAKISPSKTVGGLSQRQRLELVSILRSR